ncbi:hypothetical protein [Actinokineospora enzanensis]|uniref:hypothetical protein n=1 Tax=Actinokineospora enzanensis TaxID=155975 RepID=UPI000378D31A|nr:hypothetical protein [Actinokineospora enzanensis]
MRADDTVRARFPHRLVVVPADRGRSRVTDPRTRAGWVLGRAELALARRFDGVRTYAAVAEGLPGATPEKVRAFETRLLALGVLEPPPSPVRRIARAVVALDRVDIGTADPTRALDVVLRRTPWLVRRSFVRTTTVLSLGVLTGLLITRGGEFVAAVPDAVRGWGLPCLLVVVLLSTVFHEGGHALACRHYEVAVREVGLGLRSLFPFAWTEPDQQRWAALPPGPRLVTVAAGPLGSLVYAAAGACLWLPPLPDPLRWLGLAMVLSGTVFIIPTLIPAFDGDAYLLLTTVPGLDNLRGRSFAHVRGLLGGTRSVGFVVSLGYVAFAALTVLGRLAVAACVVWLLLW